MCLSRIQNFGYETALERILDLLAGGIRSRIILLMQNAANTKNSYADLALR